MMSRCPRSRDGFTLARRGTRHAVLGLCAVLAVWSSGCAISVVSGKPPENCQVDESLVGTWSDRRMTQLGPAWESMQIKADCTATVRAQLLYFGAIIRVRVQTHDRVAHVEQRGGSRDVPYRVEGATLFWQETPSETVTYTRRRR